MLKLALLAEINAFHRRPPHPFLLLNDKAGCGNLNNSSQDEKFNSEGNFKGRIVVRHFDPWNIQLFNQQTWT